MLNLPKPVTTDSKLSDNDAEFYLENAEFIYAESKKNKKNKYIVVNGRKIRNNSQARNGILGIKNRNHLERRQEKFFNDVANGNDDGLIRIVETGDSWFNYPTKLLEITDQIFDNFSLFSTSYGGDWLANLYHQQDYTQAIKLFRPDVFIISGGGNDLVGGGRFEEFLNKQNKAATLSADELFKQEVFDKFLKDIEILYRTIFKHITKGFPSIKIVCHGYDYPSVERADSKEKKWFGRPFSKKDIMDKSIRFEIVKNVMTQFNDMLSEVASDYNDVSYLDLRDKAPRHKWKDELHPTSDGFKPIANAFRNHIKGLFN